MESSQAFMEIVYLLNLYGAEFEDALVILTTIQDAGKEEELLDWMLEQENPPKVNLILEKAVSLSGLIEKTD